MTWKPFAPGAGRIDDATSQFLDAARWIAAFVVVISHVGGLLLVSPDQVADPSLGLKLYFWLRNGGHAAVVVFFVVSGFLVGGQELVRILEGRPFSVHRYSVQRFSRIYVVLVPALLLTGLLDLAGQIYFNQSLLYTTTAAQGIDSLKYVVADRHDAATLTGNLLMLQTIAVAPFGANGPLWSLANEWWYYVIFGLVLLSLSANRPPVLRLAALCGGVGVLGAMPLEISLWFALWLVGVGAGVLHRIWGGINFGLAAWVLAAALGVALYGMLWPPVLEMLPAPA